MSVAVTQFFWDFWAVISGLKCLMDMQSSQTKVNPRLYYQTKAKLSKPYTFGAVVAELSVTESVFSVL